MFSSDGDGELTRHTDQIRSHADVGLPTFLWGNWGRVEVVCVHPLYCWLPMAVGIFEATAICIFC